MRVIIFDLDLTLASTEACHAYLRSNLGRQDIVPALKSGGVSVSFYGAELVAYFNSLKFSPGCCVAVVSDSPKDYCVQVLAQGGYQIADWLVFGSQSKPLVKQEVISEAIAQGLGVDVDDLSFLVVGDSPKDIYYAHAIKAPSVFVSWGSKQVQQANYSVPSAWADTVQELKGHVERFVRGDLEFEFVDFRKLYLTVAPNSKEFIRVALSDDDIGFGKDYIKNKDNYRGVEDKWAATELHSVVKQAKNLSAKDHEARIGTPLYGVNGLYNAFAFKAKAWHFKNDFTAWCRSKNITGNVLLVPVPPSVPRECNLTHSMSLMCGWWKYWINSENFGINVRIHDAFERFWPKVPSHQTTGWREMDEQFDTLGVFNEIKGKVKKIDFVVIVDDVVTSGSHMNAVASFMRTAEMVDEGVVIFGYALFKTLRVDASNDIDWSFLDDL
ncbi:HAD family hydrolase [Pseudomonas bubulae]|uniref:HAD family hydrolase n=1 Tax=Pseudomonas bubulae TaxID=2316085 RepID=UPI0039A009CB